MQGQRFCPLPGFEGFFLKESTCFYFKFSMHYQPRERLRAMLADAARALGAHGAVCLTFMDVLRRQVTLALAQEVRRARVQRVRLS